MSDIPLRDRLRVATTDSHAALDANVSGWRLQTATGYGAFLSASAAALSPLEHALERAGVADWLPDWPIRARSDLRAGRGRLARVRGRPDLCA